MVSERRRWPRQRYEAAGWIEHKGERIACRVYDISEGGARLRGVPVGIGNRFILSLTEDGSDARLCARVWQSEDDIGVRFLAQRPVRRRDWKPDHKAT